MSCFSKMFEKFKEQSKGVIMAIVFAKFLFGVGLGILLASYFQRCDCKLFGWLLIVVSLIIHIPAAYKILIKK